MRTNHQIHSEASSLWYSELQLIVLPAHIRYLDDLDVPGLNDRVWRRNPLQYIPNLDDRRPTYTGPELAGGMEPYVFNRFKKVVVNATFDPDMEKVLLPMYDDFTVEHQDEARLILVPRYAVLFNNIFRLLRNSLSIERLSLVIAVDVPWPNDIIALLNETDEERCTKLKATADKRAVDILLECDLLSPIRCLINVKSLEIDIDVLHNQRHQPQRRHKDMLENLKRDVERNWLENQKLDNVAMTPKVADMVSTDI